MTDSPLNYRNPRHIFRKNTPSETRENWQYVKSQWGAVWKWIRFILLCLLLITITGVAYFKGYFDGAESILKESHK